MFYDELKGDLIRNETHTSRFFKKHRLTGKFVRYLFSVISKISNFLKYFIVPGKPDKSLSKKIIKHFFSIQTTEI